MQPVRMGGSMIGLGPVPMPVVVLAVALLIAAWAGRLVLRRAHPDVAGLRIGSLFFDVLLVGLLAGRLAFVLQWLPLYLEDPWAILRPGDGGYSAWAAVLAALALAAWRGWRQPALRRPLAWGGAAGFATWAALTGSLWVLQQARIQLPDTRLERIEGGAAQLSAMTGQPMVVNLWATWCPPCRREMPVLAQAQREHPGVTFVFANQGEGADEIRDFLRRGGLALRNVLLDPFSSVSEGSGARGLPTTLFFDANGRLVDTHMGELTRAGLAQKLRRVAGSPGFQPTPRKP